MGQRAHWTTLQITVSETVGLKVVGYYDNAGAMRIWCKNHFDSAFYVWWQWSRRVEWMLIQFERKK